MDAMATIEMARQTVESLYKNEQARMSAVETLRYESKYMTQDIRNLWDLMDVVFETFPSENGLNLKEPYISTSYDKKNDDNVTCRVELSYWPYFNDNNRIYEWALENVTNYESFSTKVSTALSLSHDGKRLFANYRFESPTAIIRVGIDVKVPDEDVWMLRSIGKIQVTEQVVRSESLVCTK